MALTQMSNAGIPLRIIQEISGHNNLEQLQRYLEVKPDQVRGAMASLSMLSYRGIAPFPDRRVAQRELSTPAARDSSLPFCPYLFDRTRCFNNFCNTLL